MLLMVWCLVYADGYGWLGGEGGHGGELAYNGPQKAMFEVIAVG